MSIITIARQYGSGGRQIGQDLAQKLNVPFYDKQLVAIAAKKSGMSEELFQKADERHTSRPRTAPHAGRQLNTTGPTEGTHRRHAGSASHSQ